MFQFLNLCRRKINLYFSCSHIETRCSPLMHQIAIMLHCCWKFFKPLQNSVISPLTYTKHFTTSPSSVFFSSFGRETAFAHCRPRDLQRNYLRLNWACCWLVTSRDMLITTDLLFEFPIMVLDCFPVGGENGIIPLCAMANSRIHGHWVSKDPSQN